MLTPVVYAAIQALYQADTGAGGLNASTGTKAVTNIYSEQAPDDAVAPYIVVTVQDEDESDSFSKDMSDVIVAFNIYVLRTGGPQNPSAVDGIDAITRRLRAVYHRVTSASITYNSNSYKAEFRRVGGLFVPEADPVYHYADRYLAMAKAA